MISLTNLKQFSAELYFLILCLPDYWSMMITILRDEETSRLANGYINYDL
jgi:hypothetical protein